jgi:hypothetical protein
MPAKSVKSKPARTSRTKTPARKVTAKVKAPAPPAAKKYGARADLGKPIDTFFDKQPGPLRAILVALRELVESVAPDATSSIKWGMPFYELGGKMFVALGAHKSHVNLILAGPPGAFKDPSGRLTGEGKTGRHLKLADISEVKRDEIRGWLETAAHLARTR